MKIQIFATGGTFEKEYNEITEKLHFVDTHLPEILQFSRVTVPVEVEQLMLIDSWDMTDEKRAMIAERCRGIDTDRIIITHGTSTMVETAGFLAQHVSGKAIVLTGAMYPYRFGGSDAPLNLGCALAFVQTLAPGVYIAMNGRYYTWDNCRKNVETGRFEEVR